VSSTLVKPFVFFSVSYTSETSITEPFTSHHKKIAMHCQLAPPHWQPWKAAAKVNSVFSLAKNCDPLQLSFSFKANV